MLVYSVKNFNSHASCEAWRQQNTVKIRECPISTHTPHARRDRRAGWMQAVSVISTHTPHARRDPFIFLSASSEYNFNSHASCEAWHPPVSVGGSRRGHFNSHASCEAWLLAFKIHWLTIRFQLTRLMRGVTYYLQHIPSQKNISTHTPHARRDIM